MDEITFNEAKLRGINLRELQKESFSSIQHIMMVREHEAKKKIHADWQKFKREDDYVPKVHKSRVKPSTSTRVISKKKQMSFTDVQLKIAIDALGKK